MLYNGIEYPVFRASLHNHTTSSDGRFSLAELAGLFHDAGYDVFAVSDHRVPNDVSNIHIPGLTVISGIELHPMGPRGILWHILALDVPKDFKGIYDTGKEAVDAAKAVGALVYAAHPRWCGLHVEEILELGELNGIEIDNSGCRLIGRAVNDEIWDELLDAGARPCHALATDDCHDWNCFAQGWTMIAAEENTHDCIMDALHPLGVAVVIEAMHTCMSLRGVQKSNAITTTSAFSGIFLSSARTRNEFLNLIK